MEGLENMDSKKESSVNWGSEDVTFGGAKPETKIVNQVIDDSKSVKHSPKIVQEHVVIFDSPWIKVKQAGGYLYSERKGIDSVAFVLIAINASDERRIGLIHEYKDPLGDFLTTAFGGSIDDEKYHSDLRTLVKDEAMEEAGFDVSLDKIEYHGKVMVSTQSNQFCHLFSVEVDKLKQGERTTNNRTELLSAVSWITMAEISKLEDWKAQAIILRRMMSRNGLVFVRAAKG